MKKAMRLSSSSVFLSLLLLASVAPPLSAQLITLRADAPGLGQASTFTPGSSAFTLLPDGHTWVLNSPLSMPGAPWLQVQDLRYDSDPLVFGNLLVQNTTAIPQTFSVSFSLPTTWVAPNQIRGSIATSLIGTDAQISALQDSSIYSALIDGNIVRRLQIYPFSLSTPQNAVSSVAQFGFDPSAIAVASTIGIELRFSLSPGDTATIVSDFEVVPEPCALAMLLLGGGIVAFRRQRR